MGGIGQGVALHDVLDAVDQIVENQVESEHLRRFLRDILAIDAATVGPDLVRQSHEQRARSCRGVVAGLAGELGIVAHQKTGDDGGDGLGREVFGILAAARRVVVLDEVFEDVGEEVVFLIEDILEVEVGQFRDQGTGEAVALLHLLDEGGDTLEDGDFSLAHAGHRENLGVGIGDVKQGAVQEVAKSALRGGVVKMAQGVLRFQARDVVAHVRPKVFHLIFGEGVVFGIPFLGLRQALAVGTVQLGLMRKLVVQELVEENLGDDLVLVSVVAQASVATHGLKRIYQVDGSLLNIHILL